MSDDQGPGRSLTWAFLAVELFCFGPMLVTVELGKTIEGFPAVIIPIVLPAIATIYDSWLFWRNRRTSRRWAPLLFCILGILWLILVILMIGHSAVAKL